MGWSALAKSAQNAIVSQVGANGDGLFGVSAPPGGWLDPNQHVAMDTSGADGTRDENEGQVTAEDDLALLRRSEYAEELKAGRVQGVPVTDEPDVHDALLTHTAKTGEVLGDYVGPLPTVVEGEGAEAAQVKWDADALGELDVCQFFAMKAFRAADAMDVDEQAEGAEEGGELGRVAAVSAVNDSPTWTIKYDGDSESVGRDVLHERVLARWMLLTESRAKLWRRRQAGECVAPRGERAHSLYI